MTEKLRVLYAEDNPIDTDLTKTHFALNAPDVDLEVVDTGRKFLDRVGAGKYDVLLIDHHLPDMEGTGILQELVTRKISLPVVMVTDVGDEVLVVQALRMGASDYVPKQNGYIERLPAVLKHAAAENRVRLAGRRPLRILYAEHDPADIDLTRERLAETAAHLTLEIARSSAQALALLRGNNFDLVLADLRMPGLNALDLLREAKHSGLTVPFIIVTGAGDETTAAAALKLGAYDYIVKRDNYLTQLPYAIDNAIARCQLREINRRLEAELAERKRAEAENTRLMAEVTRQRQRLDEIIVNVPGAVWDTRGHPADPNQEIYFISKYVEKMLGYSVQEWLSTPNFWLRIVHPDDRERVARGAAAIFASGEGGSGQFRWIAQDGRIVWVESYATVIRDKQGNPTGMRGVTIDITAAKEAEQARAQLEEELRQAQKMESIGRLAGGVAHDFNNLLTVINGYADMLLVEVGPDDPLRVRLSEIRRAGERAADLTRQLLALSRKQLLQPRILSLNSLITDSAMTLRHLLGEHIELITDLDTELGQVKADPGQMDQVILNLIANSRDAMPRGGRLTLATRNVVLEEGAAQDHLSLEPGRYVVLEISDTGAGMDPETLSHIFEPFFTTKEHGKGTGLGLSTVYGIVKQSHGSISVQSEPGSGTTCRIYLPRIDEPVRPAEGAEAEIKIAGGSETVLVVEDEESVRKLICQTLRVYGYQALEAANGNEALLASEGHEGPIPLMITDVVMPQMSGRELSAKLRSLRPEMRVLYVSGYTDDAVIRLGSLDPRSSFLQKPFSPRAVAQKVREMLDR